MALKNVQGLDSSIDVIVCSALCQPQDRTLADAVQGLTRSQQAREQRAGCR